MSSNIKEALEIRRVNLDRKLNLSSITPDIGRRVARANEITRTIGKIKQSQGKVLSGSPGQIAEKLGVYDKLGVTKEEVLQEKESKPESPEVKQSESAPPEKQSI